MVGDRLAGQRTDHAVDPAGVVAAAIEAPFEAVDAPRLHCALDGTVSVEASRVDDAVLAELRRVGFTIKERDAYSFYLGCIQLVLRDRRRLIGVADPRRDGSAAGPRR